MQFTTFEFNQLPLQGCYLIQTKSHEDQRGVFTKNFQKSVFAKSPIGRPLEFVEDFYSFSKPGVLRGLHFQKSPAAHDKLVMCLQGEILDVGLDIRKGSATFGKYFFVNLSGSNGQMAFLPAGIAHGFYVPRSSTTDALVYYKVTSEHDSAHDSGVLWNSARIPWPDTSPIISERDQKFVTLAELNGGLVF